MSDSSSSLIAAIRPGHFRETDRLLNRFAHSLIDAGWQVRGLIQESALLADAYCEIVLIDLSDNSRHPITQDLGSCSSACRLDPGAMVEAGSVLRRIDSADLVIINRYGRQEAEGQGFAAEMLDLMSRDIPVMTVVQDSYLDRWQRFTGGLSAHLPAEQSALEDWFSRVSAQRGSSGRPE